MYTGIERTVLARLWSLFGQSKVESVEEKCPGYWLARIRGGRVVQVRLNEDGTLCFQDQEVIC